MHGTARSTGTSSWHGFGVIPILAFGPISRTPIAKAAQARLMQNSRQGPDWHSPEQK
jgi:hypothetical protein